MKVVKASELGTYLYCKRAWVYQKQGIVSQHQEEFARGNDFHRTHGKKVLLAFLVKLVGWMLLLGALVAAAVIITRWIIG